MILCGFYVDYYNEQFSIRSAVNDIWNGYRNPVNVIYDFTYNDVHSVGVSWRDSPPSTGFKYVRDGRFDYHNVRFSDIDVYDIYYKYSDTQKVLTRDCNDNYETSSDPYEFGCGYDMCHNSLEGPFGFDYHYDCRLYNTEGLDSFTIPVRCSISDYSPVKNGLYLYCISLCDVRDSYIELSYRYSSDTTPEGHDCKVYLINSYLENVSNFQIIGAVRVLNGRFYACSANYYDSDQFLTDSVEIFSDSAVDICSVFFGHNYNGNVNTFGRCIVAQILYREVDSDDIGGDDMDCACLTENFERLDSSISSLVNEFQAFNALVTSISSTQLPHLSNLDNLLELENLIEIRDSLVGGLNGVGNASEFGSVFVSSKCNRKIADSFDFVFTDSDCNSLITSIKNAIDDLKSKFVTSCNTSIGQAFSEAFNLTNCIGSVFKTSCETGIGEAFGEAFNLANCIGSVFKANDDNWNGEDTISGIWFKQLDYDYVLASYRGSAINKSAFYSHIYANGVASIFNLPKLISNCLFDNVNPLSEYSVFKMHNSQYSISTMFKDIFSISKAQNFTSSHFYNDGSVLKLFNHACGANPNSLKFCEDVPLNIPTPEVSVTNNVPVPSITNNVPVPSVNVDVSAPEVTVNNSVPEAPVMPDNIYINADGKTFLNNNNFR